MKILCKDLVTRTGILLRDLFLESLHRELTYRSLTDIFCGNLFETPCADRLSEGSCTAASTEKLSRRSCTQSSTEIFAKGTCRI